MTEKIKGCDDVLYVIVPAYNEEENIEQCVKDWYPMVKAHDGHGKSRLVIIDDGSTDSTYEKLMELKETHLMLEPLTKENGGHGETVLYGYRYAIEHNADYIFQTDSDGQTNPAEFEKFWLRHENYDAIIGNRVKRGDGKCRKFVENTVCFLLSLIFDVKVKDANAPFRLMKTSLISKYIDKLPPDYNIPNIMFTTYFMYNHESVRFLPITFKPRVAGKNSVNIRKIIKIGKQAVKDFYSFKNDMAPIPLDEISAGDYTDTDANDADTDTNNANANANDATADANITDEKPVTEQNRDVIDNAIATQED